MVSAINERIERIGSSAKDARLFHKLTAKSRPGKKYRSLAEPAVFMKEAGDGGNSRVMAAHYMSDQQEGRSGWHVANSPTAAKIRLSDAKGKTLAEGVSAD